MARHQERNHDGVHGAQSLLTIQNLPTTVNTSSTGEEEAAADVDEPPDDRIQYRKMPTPHTQRHTSESEYQKTIPPNLDRRASLLTQALLTRPEPASRQEANPPASNLYRGMSNASTYSNASAASTADLTSDGGLTSPARTSTPSPPLPPATGTGLHDFHGKKGMQTNVVVGQEGKHQVASKSPSIAADRVESTLEGGLGRKRCITFACGRKSAQQTESNTIVSDPPPAIDDKPPQTAKRPCMLRFVCPSKPARPEPSKAENRRTTRFQSPPPPEESRSPATPRVRAHRDSESTITATPRSVPNSPVAVRSRKPALLDDSDLERSEATRFHEFASSVGEEDEWINEQTVHRHRITVHDTLKKEHAIRHLGEEADEEALQEEDEELMVNDIGDDNEDQDDAEEDYSDGGNETDDEGGFAQSDEESDAGSDYQFWTPALTTAATSADHLEHIRPSLRRHVSASSIESMVPSARLSHSKGDSPDRPRKSSRTSKSTLKARPGTPDLPDSTDFVCGTLDEDRPLEAAYMSCLEERKRSKHTIIPQDIDPSFPVSDPEDEDEDGNELEAVAEVSDEQIWITGQLDDYDDAALRGRTKNPTGRHLTPKHSPKRMHSPPPPKRAVLHRSPPPRRLFGHSPTRMRSPQPVRNMHSPPSTRRPSFATSPKGRDRGIRIHLAQRPHLTHTKSLPRSPNPRWHDGRIDLSAQTSAGNSVQTNSPLSRDSHRRGPIDIVTGLEKKRQRRKEKFWRQHCRQPGKERERKPQPGKGAERMRELGLEMAGKGKGQGYMKQSDLVLSI